LGGADTEPFGAVIRALKLQSNVCVTSTILATVLMAGLAAGEPGPTAEASSSGTWEQYPAYSMPPLVAAAAETQKRVEPVKADVPSDPQAPFLGALLDAGVPDGAGVSIAVRPWRWLRIQAGATHNLVSTGIRGGVALVPFYWYVTPSLTVEAGHFFPGDATWVVHLVSTSVNSSLLNHVGYDYGNAQLGLELGSPRSVAFFVRGGISYLQTKVNNVSQAIQDHSIQAGPVSVSGVFPSAKLGLIIYFF
jgi:hypothetical protein